MEDYRKIYSFLPYFEGLAAARENPDCNSELFMIRQDWMYAEYSEKMMKFPGAVEAAGFIDRNYTGTLKEYAVENEEEMGKRLDTADETLLKAILTYMMRTERFVSGAWASYEEKGFFLKTLRRMGILYGYSS